MSSVRRRVLDLITSHLRTEMVPHIARSVDQDLRGALQVGSAGCPCLFVVTAENARGTTEHMPYQQVRETLAFSIIGYAVSDTSTEDGVARAREDFLQQTVAALYKKDANDDEILHKALLADAITNNSNGAIDIRHSSPPDTDGGFSPPFGIFHLPCEATLHYQRDAF